MIDFDVAETMESVAGSVKNVTVLICNAYISWLEQTDLIAEATESLFVIEDFGGISSYC